jgi:predicted nucleic acid-binding protein
MAFTVIYDACVLYPAPLRDLLVRIAQTRAVRARWSEKILDECFRSIRVNRPDLAPEALDRTRKLMTEAVRDCIVTGYESLVEGIALPDPDDRHVVAAAVRSGAQAVVTFNLADFPVDLLAPYDIEPRHPGDFVLETIDLAGGAGFVCSAVSAQAKALKNPPQSIGDVLDTLRGLGLVQSVAKLRELFAESGGLG